ncbi:hypothetical protein TYRP_019996 [Tyrophagus putrescentiae]|nr:hypothetical protein TYRP_019996 [Tyrophagus putrescentiae]
MYGGTFYKYFTNKPQMLKAGVIWLIGTDGLGHNELASCVPSRRTMPINQMTSVNAYKFRKTKEYVARSDTHALFNSSLKEAATAC